MPFGIGPTELFFVFLIVLVVFGAGRLPEIGRSMGRAITEFKRGVSDNDGHAASPAPPTENDRPGPTRT